MNTLVLVTRLDDGTPVEGARVSIRTTSTTPSSGAAPPTRTASRWRRATDAARPGADVGAARSWSPRRRTATSPTSAATGTKASSPGTSASPTTCEEAQPLLRGSVFADRGVYRLGEEVHLKAILRSDTAEGMRLLDRGHRARDRGAATARARSVDKRTLPLSRVEQRGLDVSPARGRAARAATRCAATVAGQKPSVAGSFLVAAYRRPDFRVDANLAGESLAGRGRLKGVVTGRYLFGAPMAGRDVRWTYSRAPLCDVPATVDGRFPPERYAFLDEEREDRGDRAAETLLAREGDARRAGPARARPGHGPRRRDGPTSTRSKARSPTSRGRRSPGRASFRVDPAPWYVGLRRPPYFADVKTGVDTEVVAVDLAGKPAAGRRRSRVTLTQVQWHTRPPRGGPGLLHLGDRAQGDRGRAVGGHDHGDARRRCTCRRDRRLLRAAGHRAATRRAAPPRARRRFYVLGAGYTAWERYDHNRIDLVPEKKRYRPGRDGAAS